MESLDQCRRLEVREKARNVFCHELERLSDHKVRILLLVSLVFRTSNFWSLRNLIKQLFHSRLLDMRLVIVNSALCASLAIYHRISNACSWNNKLLISTRKPFECLLTKGSEVEFRETQLEAGFDYRAPISLKSFSEFPDTGQAHSYSSFPHSSKTNIWIDVTWSGLIWFVLNCILLAIIVLKGLISPCQFWRVNAVNSYVFVILTFLQGVQSVVTHSLQSILHSLGGIQVSCLVAFAICPGFHHLKMIIQNSSTSMTSCPANKIPYISLFFYPLTSLMSCLAVWLPFALQELLLQ